MITSTRLTTQLLRGTAAFALGLTASIACVSTAPNPNHCSNTTGDVACAEKYPDGSRPFCGVGTCFADVEDGCVEARPSDECYTPCGGRMTFDDDDSCIGGTDDAAATDGTASMTMGDTLDGPDDTADDTTDDTDDDTTGDSDTGNTTGPIGCEDSSDCSGATPLCIDSICDTCDASVNPDAACLTLGPENPVCIGNACMQCETGTTQVCDDQLLVCDDATNSCVPCTAHGECAIGACELIEGTCFPADSTVTDVDADGGAANLTIALGINAVPNGGYGIVYLHERNGDISYQEATTISGGKTLALLAAMDESPIIQGNGGNPGLSIDSPGPETTVYVDGVTFQLATGASGLGVRVDASTAWFDRSRIVQNSAGGVSAVNGANLTLRNCFVAGITNVAPALNSSVSNVDVRYSTLGRTSNFGEPVLVCTGGSVDVFDSIIVNETNVPGNELSCAATLDHTAVVSTQTPLNWFADFSAGDYHLTGGGATPFANVAEWNTGDPTNDIDDQNRAMVDGTAEAAGADLP